MTVIAYAYTPDGFVVGADSRLILADTHRVDTDCQRKLIHLRAPGVDLVCGWAGAAVIGSENGSRFDLTDETERIGTTLSGEYLGDNYIKTLSERLRESFADQLACLRSWKAATAALFVGYFHNKPQLYAQHWEWVLSSEPEKKPAPQMCRFRLHSGCSEFEACDLEGLPTPSTSKVGEEGLRRYIECCRANCPKYGGWTQILTIPKPSF